MISTWLTAPFWQARKFLPKMSIVRSLPRPLFEQFDGGRRRAPGEHAGRLDTFVLRRANNRATITYPNWSAGATGGQIDDRRR
jgi:hypothetical protein